MRVGWNLCVVGRVRVASVTGGAGRAGAQVPETSSRHAEIFAKTLQ